MDDAIKYARRASNLNPHNLQVQENLKFYVKKADQKRKKSNLRKLFWQSVGVIALLVVVSLICTRTPDISQPTYNTPSPTRRPTEETIYAIDFVEIVKESWKCDHDSIGNVIFTGKVKNIGVYQLTLVTVRGTIYTSENGSQINTNVSYIDSDVLDPGTTSTFTIYVNDPEGEATHCQVGIEDAYFTK